MVFQFIIFKKNLRIKIIITPNYNWCTIKYRKVKPCLFIFETKKLFFKKKKYIFWENKYLPISKNKIS